MSLIESAMIRSDQVRLPLQLLLKSGLRAYTHMKTNIAKIAGTFMQQSSSPTGARETERYTI